MTTLDISKIDKNFAAETITYEGIHMYHILEEPFCVYGLYNVYEEKEFKRMPNAIAENVNEMVRELYTNPSGGRVRFRTNSKKILVRSVMSQLATFPHMPKTGTSCFDLYIDGEYYDVFRHDILSGVTAIAETRENVYDSCLSVKDGKMHDILIHFPLYNTVDNVWIGLDEGAEITKAEKYKIQKPITFYGSSITQGGCASHPGNCYVNMLSRRLNADVRNLGFSAGCLGEELMAEYIAELDMSVLVYDYDHNAPTAEKLWESHESAFRIIRKKRPELPIIIITAADRKYGTQMERKRAIRTTYEHALALGDNNVYFLDGDEIYAPIGRSECTVDAIHPNDLGFHMMANAVEKILRKIFFV